MDTKLLSEARDLLENFSYFGRLKGKEHLPEKKTPPSKVANAKWNSIGDINSFGKKKKQNPTKPASIIHRIHIKHRMAGESHNKAQYHAGHKGSWIADEVKKHRDDIKFHHNDAVRLYKKLPAGHPQRGKARKLISHIGSMHRSAHNMYMKAKTPDSKEGNWWD